jgi:hypothetical protein
MPFHPAAVAVLALFAAAPIMAAPLTIDFEDAPSFSSIADHYAAQGVSFGGGALGLQNDVLGPYFSNAPSPIGVMFTVDTDSAMNVAQGFSGLFSFSYASTAAATGALSVWSGLDGTGDLLASFDLLGNSAACTTVGWCSFDALSSSLSQVAYSVTFSGDPTIAFDNIALNTVPEPASLLLVALGLAGLTAQARRRNK